MTSVEFEAATLADALRKAQMVAPPASNRNAFDKAAGIFMEINPGDPVQCMIRSTNLDVFYMEVVDVLVAEGAPTEWRLPSDLIAKTVASLQSDAGRKVKIADDPNSNRIIVTSGRLRAGMAKMDPKDYQQFSPSSHVAFTEVEAIGGKISQVAWAAAKADPPLNGVHFTGTHIVATDRYRVARVPCVVALPEPVTIPASVLSSIMKQTAEVQVGLDSTMMYFRPDDYTEIATVTLADQYPNIEKVLPSNYDSGITLDKTELISKINNAMNYAGTDRNPLLRLFIGKGEVAALLGNEADIFRDVIEVPGQCNHPRIEIGFTPKNLIDTLNNAPGATVTIKYNTTQATTAVYVDGGSGWEGWVMARKVPKSS